MQLLLHNHIYDQITCFIIVAEYSKISSINKTKEKHLL